MKLDEQVIDTLEKKSDFKPLVNEKMTVEEKIFKIATEIYRAKEVNYSEKAKKDLKKIKEQGLNYIPVCIAKTPYSFSDDPKKLGAPINFTLNVTELIPQTGANFIVVKTGKIMTMPGLPKDPAANHIYVDEKGRITGLF